MTSVHFEVVHTLFECLFFTIRVFYVAIVIIAALNFAAVFYALIIIFIKILASDVASYNSKDIIVYEQ